ncbi:MAG: CatB-related O-acetyltransferase [Bacteroidetes bacterium]|nr:MAG: CatB-related O-acetyltransferase [Bacteroidota bacterium]
MAFGIVKTLRNFSPIGIILNLKRQKDLIIHRNKGLILPLHYNIIGTKFGHNVYLGSKVTIVNSSIGDNSYVNDGSKIVNASIGKFCSIGPNVRVVLGKHPISFVSTHPTFYAKNKPFRTYSDKNYFNEYDIKVEIGNDVWIGENVIIPNGVKIGNGAIISSGAVVTKDVEPYSIVGGIPATLIKYRFEPDLINKLNNSEWWNWDEKLLKSNFIFFQDPEKFVRHFNL